jgi:hypothetical protein
MDQMMKMGFQTGPKASLMDPTKPRFLRPSVVGRGTIL